MLESERCLRRARDARCDSEGGSKCGRVDYWYWVFVFSSLWEF